ncbi:MAG: protein translocase subunit SecD [Deltaproteobacteria bacterium]|nr:protein translocase subunit SecD [Deltaproteobacteria bacterium]
MKNIKWREVLVVVVLISGFVYLTPTLFPTLPPWWTKFLPKEKIHLGLDLQGGMHLVLEVEADKAVINTADRMVEDIKETLRKEKIPFNKIERAKSWDIQVSLPSPEGGTELNKLMEKFYPILRNAGGETNPEGYLISYTFQDKEVQRVRELAVDQALQTIRNRIDQFGVTEPDIRREREDRIQVQLPGIQDPQRAIDLVGKTALLEFKLVAEGVSPQDSKEGKLPPGVKIYPMKRANSAAGRTSDTQIALKDRTLMTGEYITTAEVRIDTQFNQPYVALEFDATGARTFERLTGENVNKQLAIVLDGTVYSAPNIREKIGGGRASITGSFTMEEARDLAIVLRAGALPAPVKILEQRTVGPGLGKDSIQKGLMASLIGAVLVVAFMLLYYKGSGLIANVALALNMVLLFAGLAAFGATLTLPGIAGIALTIGMAVDANVLIYERIREELRLGKTPRAAVEAGYEKATVTIIDSNLTTLIAAFVLFQFGTGPVKGFAVTLTIGLVANLFTAIIVTRSIFDYLLLQRRIKSLSI